MKMSWLGKILLADAAIGVAKAVYNRSQRDDDAEEDEAANEESFSNAEVEQMMHAVARNDYFRFSQIYTERCPGAKVSRVAWAYKWFQERKLNGWRP